MPDLYAAHCTTEPVRGHTEGRDNNSASTRVRPLHLRVRVRPEHTFVRMLTTLLLPFAVLSIAHIVRSLRARPQISFERVVKVSSAFLESADCENAPLRNQSLTLKQNPLALSVPRTHMGRRAHRFSVTSLSTKPGTAHPLSSTRLRQRRRKTLR